MNFDIGLCGKSGYQKIHQPGIGGAGGKGLVLENGHVIGLSKLAQATLGFQAGGQQYTQAIFFENKEALDNFTNGKFKFSSEASAVALKSGVSMDSDHHLPISMPFILRKKR